MTLTGGFVGVITDEPPRSVLFEPLARAEGYGDVTCRCGRPAELVAPDGPECCGCAPAVQRVAPGAATDPPPPGASTVVAYAEGGAGAFVVTTRELETVALP